MSEFEKSLVGVAIGSALGASICFGLKKRKENKKEDTIDKAVKIAGGITIVSMMLSISKHKKEIIKLWDLTEINKILWIKKIFEDGLIDESYKNDRIMECLSYIHNDELKREMYAIMEVKKFK